VGRGRGGCEAVLSTIKPRSLVVGIRSDVLYPTPEQDFLAKHLPNVVYKQIDSLYGHDGFLTEGEKLTDLIKGFLTENSN